MAHEELWKQLSGFNGPETSQRAGCQYQTDSECYAIRLLNREYTVSQADRQIFSLRQDFRRVPAEYLEQLCILAYLLNAQDLPPADKLVKAEALPGGQFFFRGHHSLPTAKLEDAFGDRPEALYQIEEQFAARRCEFGDASIQLYVLPRIPLTIVIWGRCEEFSARASILFDQTAADQLPLDALWTAVNLTVEALIKACPSA